MISFRSVSAAAIALGLGMPGPVAAMPQTTAATDSSVVLVQTDCHRDARRHYLPEYGRRVWHRHRQSNCRVVLADPAEDDEEDEPQRRDCHRDVQRHYIEEYGRRVTHRHVGNRCRVKEYQRNSEDDPRPGGNCVQLGPIQYCEN